jgi:hypothetical protein
MELAVCDPAANINVLLHNDLNGRLLPRYQHPLNLYLLPPIMTTDNTPTNNLSKKETVIAVVGGGIGGILTAIGLGKQGYTVHLFEQAAKFSEIGAGIAMYVPAWAHRDVCLTG